MNVTPEFVSKHTEKMWQEAIEKYGSEYSVPSDVAGHISEIYRALHVVRISSDSGNLVRALESYSISEKAIKEVVTDILKVKSAIKSLTVEERTPKKKRADKWGAFLEWAKKHPYEEFTTDELVKVSGFSYPTTLKYIQQSPAFTKIKKGRWEVKNLEELTRR
jgi:hypothetical protein